MSVIDKKAVDGMGFWEIIGDSPSLSRITAEALKDYYDIESYSGASENKPSTAALGLITADFAFRHGIIPVEVNNTELKAAFADPLDALAREELELVCAYRVKPMYAPMQDMRILLDAYYGKDRLLGMTDRFINEAASVGDRSVAEANNDVQNAPAVKLLDSVLEMAVTRSASDIHIEPCKEDTRVRFRIDGRLVTYERLNGRLHSSLISRLKILGQMDIAEKRLPQDGRFISLIGDTKIDFRLSTVPSLYGEKAVIRLLYDKPLFMDKTKLGFSNDALAVLNQLFSSSHGAILLTGPTGSGKSTTMAAFLRELNTGENNIITVEDPVENVIDGVTHININPKAGFAFPDALRSILRQDPDIIMVGEIREPDTAKLAINSALTGHLVLTTLHTNDAVSAIYRLIDMDVADYLVYAAVRGVVSQRLVRRLCPECKEKTNVTPADALVLGLDEGATVFAANGCKACGGTGYAGRFAIYEILIADDTLLKMFTQKTSYEDIKKNLKAKGMETLRDCGIKAVLNGSTSIRELVRTVLE